MADQKISGMAAATTPLTGTESVELVQGGVNKQATVQDIADLANPPTTPELATVLTNGNDASGIPIIGLPSPTVGSEATNKDYVDAGLGSVGTPALGSVVAQGNDTGGVAIIGLPTPTVGSEATNKDYVDGVASGSAHLADYTTVNDAAPLAANCNNLKEPKFYTEIANNRTIDFTNVRAVNNANQYVVVFWVFKKTVAGDIVITLDADSSQFTNKDLAADTAATAYTLTGASNTYFKLTAVFHGESSGSIVWWNLVTTSTGGGGGTWGSIAGTLSSQTDLQAALDAKLALAGGTMSGAIAMNNNKISGLAAPTTNGDAVRYQQMTAVEAAVALKLDKTVGFTDVTASATLATTDFYKTIRANHASNTITITIPLASALTGIQAGDWFCLRRDGAGVVQVAPVSGSVTINSSSGGLTVPSDHLSHTIYVVYEGSNVWTVQNGGLPFGVFQTWTPTLAGWSSNPTFTAKYMQIGKMVHVWIRMSTAGTSNATTKTITLPVAAVSAAVQCHACPAVINNNTQDQCGLIYTRTGSTTADILRGSAATFTASGNCRMDFSFSYEAD